MRTYLVTFVLSLLGAAALTPAVRHLAVSVGAVDRALSSRRVHTGPIPRLGGVAIVVAFYLPIVGLLLFDNTIAQAFKSDRGLVFGLLVGGLAIVALGLYDDLRGANAWKKFAVQFAVAGFMYALGFRMDCVATPFGGELTLGWLGLPSTLLWIVGVINALNLIDGLDGLAGGVALFAVLTCFAIAFQRNHVLLIVFTVALAGSILGFLFYNFNPATIFMGDTGSMFLGFVLAVTSLRAGQKSATTVAILVPIVALGLPLMDTVLAMVRRLVRGQSPFTADRDHIHHRLLARGLSHRAAALLLYGVCILLGLAAFALSVTKALHTAILLGVLAVTVAVFVRWLGYGAMRVADWRHSLEQRYRNRIRTQAARLCGAMLQPARNPDEVFASLAVLTDVLGASRVVLQVVGAATDFRRGSATPDAFRLSLPLLDAGEQLGTLEVAWADGRTEVDRDDEIALESVVAGLAAALRRTASGSADGAKVIRLH